MVAALIVALLAGPQHPTMPPGMSHEEHLKQMAKDAELEKRGAAAMGFDQGATTHHFLIDDQGGTIQVTVNDRADRTNREAIRSHLRTIARDFAQGVFAAPFATHGEQPPGVATLRERKAAVAYRYEEIDGGARVRITTTDAQALAAAHDFLRYQIREHKTGDPEVR
jgi:hypothetical protein